MAKDQEIKKNSGWKQLVDYCRAHLFKIIMVLVFALLGSVFSLAGPNQLSKITDMIIGGMKTGIDLPAIGKVGIMLTALYVIGFIFNYIKGFIMAGVTQEVTDGMRNQISEKINRLPLKYFDSTSYGDILSRVTNDVDVIGQTLNQGLPTLISSATMFFGALILMFTVNWLMAITAVAVSILGFWLMSLIIKRSQKYFIAQQEEIGNLNGYIEEMYTGHSVVKVYGAGEQVRGEFSKINKKLYKSAWVSQFLSGMMMPLMTFVGNLGYVMVCVLGAVLAKQGHISFGAIVAFMVYIRQFTNPLTQIAQVATNLQSTSAASTRVFEFLGEEELPDESGKTEILENVQGNVEFQNVKFGYSPEKIIVNNFSAKANKGQKIAIVGPTGAGKTTIVNLLMRFYEIDSGRIMIDGVDLSTLTRENVHDLFCMVLQDTWLFEGTIRENIVYSKEDVSVAEVTRACKAVGIDHFIRTLPQGYNTVLDDKSSLSAGQKQQLTIARAMVENSPLLILDEATSSVDTRSELLIQRAMDKLMVGRTSFVIAHRLSTIKNADLILVMKDGDIVESGSHDDLLENGGFYASLYNSQFDQAS